MAILALTTTLRTTRLFVSAGKSTAKGRQCCHWMQFTGLVEVERRNDPTFDHLRAVRSGINHVIPLVNARPSLMLACILTI